MIDVNIKGVLYGIAAALPHMKRQKAGTSSTCRPWPGTRSGRRRGLCGDQARRARAVRRARQEVKPYNIRTTVISPGVVATELPDSITEPDVAESCRSSTASSRIPADIFARVVAFAMSQPEDVDMNEILFRPTRQEF